MCVGWSITGGRHKTNVRQCHALCAFDEVFCLVACTTFANVCTRNLLKMTKSTWLERVYTSHQCWSCHSSWCCWCHVADSHQYAEDEDDACDQWDLQLWLCHSRSARGDSLKMVFGALFLSLESRDSLVLVHVQELQVCEWFPGNRFFLSQDLGSVRRLRPIQDCFHFGFAVSRYRQYSAIRPILVWDARNMSTLIRRS